MYPLPQSTLSAPVIQTFPVPLLGAKCGDLSNSGEEYCRKHHRPAKSLGVVDYVPAQKKNLVWIIAGCFSDNKIGQKTTSILAINTGLHIQGQRKLWQAK